VIAVPQSTVEKPLTAIDYMVPLEQCASLTELADYTGRVPEAIREDERFTKAVACRLAVINHRREPA
jgi:hypothetical protein